MEGKCKVVRSKLPSTHKLSQNQICYLFEKFPRSELSVLLNAEVIKKKKLICHNIRLYPFGVVSDQKAYISELIKISN